MIERIAAALGATLLFAILLPWYLRLSWAKEIKSKALSVKAACTLVAVVFGVWGALRLGSGFGWLMAAGLLAGMAADVLIGLNFVTGIVAFLLGHLFYITAFCSLGLERVWISAVVFAVVYGVLLLIFRPHFALIGRVLIPGLIYMAVLSAMFALTVPFVLDGDLCGLLLAAGGLLFLVSDSLLVYGTFVRRTHVGEAACLYCYYLAQLLLAFGVFLPTVKL